MARVRFEKVLAPWDVNVMLTVHWVPFVSRLALALWMSSPVRPTNAGLYPGSGPLVTLASGTHFV